MEPTISFIVAALAMGIAAGLKDTASEAVSDIYKALKKLIQDRYQISLTNLEENPSSTLQKSAVEESLHQKNVENDEEVLEKAKKLFEVVQAEAPQTAARVGVDLDNVRAAKIHIERILSSDIGVKVKNTEVEGELRIKDVTVHPESSKPDPNLPTQ